MIDQYVPDQYEMARRALVGAATPDGSVNVTNDPTFGSSPFLYGKAKPKTPLEQQMEREQMRQLKDQQRYDALQQELTTIPQWQADRMGPGAAIEARQRGAQVAGQLPRPGGTPMSDAYAAGEQDIANIPRVGAIQRNEGVQAANTNAMTFMNPLHQQQRSMATEEAARRPEALADREQDQRFNMVRSLLQGLFSNPNMPPDWNKVSSLLDLIGMSGEGIADTSGGAGGAAVMSMQDLQAIASREGITLEEAMEDARAEGITIGQ